MIYSTEVFEIEDNNIRFTISFDDVGLNKTKKKVVALLIEDSSYTSDELAAKIGLTKQTHQLVLIVNRFLSDSK